MIESHAPKTLVAGLREMGFRMTLTSCGQLRVSPASRLNDGARQWIEKHRAELIANLEDERVGSGAEVVELARHRFPNREDLPAPPPVPGRDPLVRRGTDKEIGRAHV